MSVQLQKGPVPTREIMIGILPPPENGIHNWLYGRACYLRDRGIPEESTLEGLQCFCAKTPMRRVPEDDEIEKAVTNAYRRTTDRYSRLGKLGNQAAKPRTPDKIPDFIPGQGWPEGTMACPQVNLNADAQSKIIASGFGQYDLWEHSPIRLDGDRRKTRQILRALYGKDELLCIGASPTEFDTATRDDWNFRRLEKLSLIVPNPMTQQWGKTIEGKPSKRCRNNTGPRRFVIVEFDDLKGLDDAQAAIVWHLKCETKAPLVLALQSGGKSIHAWFACTGVPAKSLWDWFCYAVSLGADERHWVPEQFCRLPDGTRRQNGNRQSVLYFDPQAMKLNQAQKNPA